MSKIKATQIKAKLLALFEPHLDLADVPAHDTEREVKVLSRCLAAFAVYHASGCSEEDAAKAVWDGADDNGIDAAYYDASESRVLLVQSKFIQKGLGEPAANEIGTFTKGAKDIVEQDFVDFHPRLKAKLNELSTHIVTPGTRIHLVVVSTGTSDLAKPGQSRIDKLLQELNEGDDDPLATAETVGLSEVYSRLASSASQGSVNLDANILEWSTVTSPYQAYFGIIDGLTLKEWWKQYGKRVVASNIRHSLGATEVNNEIRNTAASYPERFWYFNNGITLVAEEAVKAPAGAASRSAGIFSFKAASVVNGAQTISSLARVDEDASLGKVRVPIRVILLKAAPVGFGNDVTRTNNLQNRIEPRDFVAQDSEQKRLREEMAIESVDYQFVRSEEASSGPHSCDLTEVTTALACAAGDPALAVQLKTGISRFFADLSKPPYKTLYNPSVTGARAFNAVLVQRHIDGWIESRKKSWPKKSGPGWGTLVHGNRILAAAVFSRWVQQPLEQPIGAFRQGLINAQLDTICEDVHTRMVATIDKYYSGKFLAVLFKNNTHSKHVFAEATA